MIKHNRRLIYKITAAFVALGFLIAIFGSVEYESESILLPEMRESSGTSDMLQSYGGMLGLSGLGSMDMSEEGMIAPQVYPMIVQSLSFQDKLLNQSVYFSKLDTSVTGYGYFKNIHSPSFFGLIAEYTIGLPKKIFGPALPAELPGWLQEQFGEEGVTKLSDEELEIVEDMNQRVEIELDPETGVLTVITKMPDPVAAAQVCKKIINMLKDFVKEYSTQKSQEDLEFAEIQYRQAQENFEEAQSKLAQFLDQNMNLSTARGRSQEQRLQAEFDIAYNRYNDVSERLTSAKAKVQEQTPVFKVLQSVNIPSSPSEPKRILILILSLITGFVVSFFFIASRNIYFNIKSKL